MIRKNLLFVLFVLLIHLVFAKNIHTLDLEKSLEIALEKSYKMKTLKENLLEAKHQLAVATNRFKTNINLDMTLPNYTETMRRFEDSLGVYYSPIQQSIYEADIRISQPLPTDGHFFLSSGIYTLQDFNKERNSAQLNTRLGFQQPIEAIYAYNEIKTSLREAKLYFELSNKQLDRAQLDLKYEVSNAFYSLVSCYESKKIAKQTMDYQQEAFTLAQNKFKAGVIAEVEALQMEVDLGVAQNNFDIAISNARSQEDIYKQILGIPLQDSIVINSDMSYKIIQVNIEEAIKRGLANRLEIREREINKSLSEINIRKTKVNGQITGSISGYYDFIGVGENDRGVAYSTLFSNTMQELQNRPGNKGVSLNISIPIWDWGVNRSRVEAAKARLRKAEYSINNEKVNVVRDIRKTVNNLKSSLKRLKLLEKNVIVAEKSFNISQERFANGDIDSQSLALNRNRLNNAYISKLEAFISYKLLIADLNRKTFYDYENDKPL